MPFSNLMDSQAERKFQETLRAILTLCKLSDSRSYFLAKRLSQGHATCEWCAIHSQCLRLTINYRGQVWKLRVPVPE